MYPSKPIFIAHNLEKIHINNIVVFKNSWSIYAMITAYLQTVTIGDFTGLFEKNTGLFLAILIYLIRL